MFGSETNLNKTVAFDCIGEIRETPNGANVALRIGRTHPDKGFWEQAAYVLLTKDEARKLAERLLEEAR